MVKKENDENILNFGFTVFQNETFAVGGNLNIHIKYV